MIFVGVYPAPHKICKNHAITVTVHKAPPNPVCHLCEVFSVVSMPTELPYLKSSPMQCRIKQLISFFFFFPQSLCQSVSSVSVVRNVHRHDNMTFCISCVGSVSGSWLMFDQLRECPAEILIWRHDSFCIQSVIFPLANMWRTSKIKL